MARLNRLNSFNIRDDLQDLSQPELKKHYIDNAKSAAIACLNLQGGLNIGTLMRTASLFALKEMHIIGRKKFNKKSTVGTDHYIPVVYHRATQGDHNDELDSDEITRILTDLSNRYTIVFIEQGGTSLDKFNFHVRSLVRRPLLFVLGNENTGIPASVISSLEPSGSKTVEIPQAGLCRSHNIAVAAGIVLWEFSKQGWY